MVKCIGFFGCCAASDTPLSRQHSIASAKAWEEVGFGSSSKAIRKRWIFDTHTWRPSSSEWDSALALIRPNEQQKVQWHKRRADRKLALASYLLQRRLINTVFGVPWAHIRIDRTLKVRLNQEVRIWISDLYVALQGKPYHQARDLECEDEEICHRIHSIPGFNYNVSHHGGVVALASEPISLVGLDIMHLEHRPGPRKGERCRSDLDSLSLSAPSMLWGEDTEQAEFFEDFEAHFTSDEWGRIHRWEDTDIKYTQFYMNWALKESHIKALGIGLDFQLGRANFVFSGRDDPRSKCAVLWVDGVRQTSWDFHLQYLELRGRHYIVSTALGPPQEAYDTEHRRVGAGSALQFMQGHPQPEFECLDPSCLAPRC